MISAKLFSLVFLIAVSLLVAEAVEVAEVKTFTRAQTADLIRRYPCKIPQPTLIYINEIEGYNLANVKYHPHAVVVNRCSRSTGCCKTGKICQSIESEENIVKFHVQAQRQQSNKMEKYEEVITLTNHNSCECYGVNFERS